MHGNGNRKATIYDLSVLSGSSPSTVSAVLNGSWRKRRIKESTAQHIRGLADEHGYTANRQAKGLRSARSGLVGLLISVHDSRYFSSMAQTFEVQARRRGQCPVVVSGGRDPELERRTVETLISYAIDDLVICGATDPDGLHLLCERAGLRHVNVDLPGSRAPSVISDNYDGARRLTEALIDHFAADEPLRAEELCLFGGRNDHNTTERVRGFRDVRRERLGSDPDGCIRLTGYTPATLHQALSDYLASEGRLPRGLFVNSIGNLEGFLRVLPAAQPAPRMAVGCFDYDPFASFLTVPVYMMRQDVEAMMVRAFELLDANRLAPALHLVRPELVPPRTALCGALDLVAEVL